MKTSEFELNVSHNLRGVHFFSLGACPGCDECGLAETECSYCSGGGKDLDEDGEETGAQCCFCTGTGKEPITDHQRDCASESSFSWSSCDSCGSSLGGGRFAAHGFIAESMQAAQSKDCEVTHFNICMDCVMYHANGDLPESCE